MSTIRNQASLTRRDWLTRTASIGAATALSPRLASGGLFTAGSAAETVIYLAPQGNDTWSGRLPVPNGDRTDGPVASLHQAVRRAREAGADQDRRIVVADGEYLLSEAVDLGRQDSGLVIEAAEGAAPSFYGGRALGEWKPDGDRFWAAEVPDARDRQWDFRMLMVNDRLCPRARLPEEGRFQHTTTFPVPWMSTTGGGWQRKPTEEELTTLQYKPEDLGDWLDVNNAEVTVFHMWDESVVGVAEHDAENHRLVFSNPCGHPPGAFGVQDYVVWNVREGMTQPGQWYLDRTAGKVVYWPLPGEEMTRAKAMAPTVESILRLQGTGEEPVRKVTVRGLGFSVTNTPLRAGGFGAGHFRGAVELNHAERCALEGLDVRNVAGQGVRAWSLRGDCRIEDCHIHDVGACGIRLNGSCLVRNNHIHDVGRIYPSAIALWGGGREGHVCRIEHNTVHDTPYTAIACGGDDHRIERNRIYRAMQVLHDGAGIYITFCKRIELRGNYIHDIIDTGGYGASAYYLDEQAEDCLVEGNLSLRVARPSHNHMARKNTIRGNVFVCEGDATMTFPRCEDYLLEKNVVVAEGAIRITRPEAIAAARDNILHSRTGTVEGAELDDYRTVDTQALEPSIRWTLVDPRLALDETGRVSFSPDGPAASLGWTELDVTTAGRAGSQ